MVIQDSIEQMHLINVKVNDSSKAIFKLGEKTNQIENIVSLTTQIASKLGG